MPTIEQHDIMFDVYFPNNYSGVDDDTEDFIKYLNNYKNGVKGYIIVNSVSGETELVKLDNGMKYMDSAYCFKNLKKRNWFVMDVIIVIFLQISSL